MRFYTSKCVNSKEYYIQHNPNNHWTNCRWIKAITIYSFACLQFDCKVFLMVLHFYCCLKWEAASPTFSISLFNIRLNSTGSYFPIRFDGVHTKVQYVWWSRQKPTKKKKKLKYHHTNIIKPRCFDENTHIRIDTHRYKIYLCVIHYYSCWDWAACMVCVNL